MARLSFHQPTKSTRALAVAAGAVAACAIWAPVGARAATSGKHPWPQTNGDAALSRANLTESVLTRHAVKHVVLLKSLVPAPPNGPFGGATCTGIPVSSPLLQGNRVFDVGNGLVSMYNGRDGHLRWAENPDPTDVLSVLDLAIGHGLVVEGDQDCTSASDPDGELVAYNASTGAEVWRAAPGPFGGPLGQMVEYGRYVLAIGDSPGSGQVISARLVGSGTLVWSQQGCGPAVGLVVVHRVVVVNACQFTDPQSDLLEGVNVATGHVLWTRAGTWSVLRGSNAGANGHAYVVNPFGHIVDLNPATGHTRLKLDGATDVQVVDDHLVYAQCGAGETCAYSESTGVRAWRIAKAGTALAEADGVLYMSNGRLRNTSTGKTIVDLHYRTPSLAVGEGRIAVAQNGVLDVYGLPGS
jgi:outer membrane protein assembly factor BamB